ncbi:MAG: ABC transporter permease [Solirubrobacteraceae bacterium]
MTPVGQTLATLSRRPGRTLLTALGTALGIATIVALLAVADGAKRSAGGFLHLGASDLGLFQKAAADPTTSVLSTNLIAQLRRTPGIADATALVLLVQDVKRDPSAIVFGGERNGFLARRLVFSEGHMFSSPSQIVVGDELAQRLHLHPGDALKVGHRTLSVTGIYHIGVVFQDTGAFIPLATAQTIAGRHNEATTIPIKLAVGARPAQVQRVLRRRFPGIAVIADPEEAARAGANGVLISKAALVIAVLALVIGGIGVLNTMLMAVLERRAEFALLSAVGWSSPQIAIRVLTEGVVTSLIGAVLGLAIGIAGAHLLTHALGAQVFVTPHVSGWDLIRALLVGVLIGVLGGLYPAWRAARVPSARVLAQA